MATVFYFGKLISIIILPLSLILLLIAARWLYPGYSITTHWISSLGETNHKSYCPYNLALGGLILVGPFIFARINHLFSAHTTVNLFFVLLLSFIGLSLFATLLFPADKNLSYHIRFANVLFTSLIIFNIASLIFINTNPLLTLASLGALISSIATLAGMYLVNKNYPQGIHDLNQLNPNEKSLLIQNVTLTEWLLLIFNLSWFLLAGLNYFR